METEAIWRVDDAPFDQRCGFYMDAEQPALLSCNGDYFLYGECPRMSKWDLRLSFGTEAKNFEDWCGHPHSPDGMELDERDTTDVTCLLLEPPYLVMVSELDPQLYGKPYEPHSCLRVYNMESYEELKAFERSSGVCSNLESNKCCCSPPQLPVARNLPCRPLRQEDFARPSQDTREGVDSKDRTSKHYEQMEDEHQHHQLGSA